MTRSFRLLLAAVSVSLFFSCGKETASLDDAVKPEDYFNLQPGKYIIYQLDSIVKLPLSDTAFTTRSYQAKDVVDAPITDNLGRPGWRIFRYLRPLNSNNEADWQPADTYQVTPTTRTVEVVENNLRFLKMVFPINESTTWKGNTYINTTPGGPLDHYDAWEYQYQQVGGSFSPFQTPVENTVTILQADEALGVLNEAPANPDLNAFRVYSVEVYAKNIGLIYKYLNYWDYEARTLNSSGRPAPPFPDGNKNGGGIRLRMISHN